MKNVIIYIHGKGGCAEEAGFYRRLFPSCAVIGFDYKSETPWEAVKEFRRFFKASAKKYEAVSLIANSIGAYYAMAALEGQPIEKAYFISPVVDMEALITGMLAAEGVTEAELQARQEIPTAYGEVLSWAYLSWVREHPLSWHVPTRIAYGSRDHLQTLETVRAFAEKTGAELTVMEGAEHWFHTEEQLQLLADWLRPEYRPVQRTEAEMIENMIAWAKSGRGAEDYAGWCLDFCEDALEMSNDIEIFGGDSAKGSAELYADAMRQGMPERGAFVFYDCLCQSEEGPVNWGHCGIGLGGGQVIHAWDAVRTDGYRAIEKLTARTGDHPKYIGWVPLSRVLAQKPDREP